MHQAHLVYRVGEDRDRDRDRVTKSISVTMRTPGNDPELAIGFLFTEGIIKLGSDVLYGYHLLGKKGNVFCVELKEGVTPETKNTERNFYTTSSCGVCGKASIASIHTVCNFKNLGDNIKIPIQTIYGLPVKLRQQQAVFEKTGGLHACALFDLNGALLQIREDVGRHNALDKLVGYAATNGLLPLANHILLLSGRASFELVQKAVMAGIKVVAAVGAPSSLAVEMAEEWELTLIGFLRGETCNIYSGSERIVI